MLRGIETSELIAVGKTNSADGVNFMLPPVSPALDPGKLIDVSVRRAGLAIARSGICVGVAV